MNNRTKPVSENIIETIFILLLFLALILALYDVLKIFFGVLTFALIFSVSFAKAYENLARLLKGRRTLAAVLYSLILIVIIALPFVYFISAINAHLKEVINWLQLVKTEGLPALPDTLIHLPYIGNEINTFWEGFRLSPKETIYLHEAQIKTVLHHILISGAGVLGVGLQLITGIIVSAFFLAGSKNMLRPVKDTIKHLLGENDGEALLEATGQAVKGVSIGVMGTAFIASILSWIGLAIAGVPFALALSALIFFFVVIQIGPSIVWIPLIVWEAMQGHTGMTIFLIIYGILIFVADAILKPVLIAKSGKLPFLVLFIGVIGGLAAWGFTGMFKGAIIMAVFYTVFNSWLEKKNSKAADNAMKESPAL